MHKGTWGLVPTKFWQICSPFSNQRGGGGTLLYGIVPIKFKKPLARLKLHRTYLVLLRTFTYSVIKNGTRVQILFSMMQFSRESILKP